MTITNFNGTNFHTLSADELKSELNIIGMQLEDCLKDHWHVTWQDIIDCFGARTNIVVFDDDVWGSRSDEEDPMFTLDGEEI